LHMCTQLQHVRLETMKGLTDLTPLLTASALTDLVRPTLAMCTRPRSPSWRSTPRCSD